MNNKIVYLAHGSKKFHHQACYSILSLLKLMEDEGYEDLDIVVYSDQPSLLPKHPRLRVIKLDASTLDDGKGPLNAVHRSRLIVLQQAVTDIGLPFIYVDGDTRWLKIPKTPFADLATQTADNGTKSIMYMHVDEGEIAQDFHRVYLKLLNRSKKILNRYGLDSIGPWRMWNAGTIGVPVGATNFFTDTLNLNDELLLYTHNRTFVDQLALSLVATKRYIVKPLGEERLHHYWSYSNEAAILLDRFFAKLSDLDVDMALREYTSFCWSELEISKLKSEPKQRRKAWRSKVKRSIQKRRVDIKAFWLRLRKNGL